MAHPYTNEAHMRRFVAGRGERLDTLLDRDEDGVADEIDGVPVLDYVVELACNRLDGELMQVYVTPLVADLSAGGLLVDFATKLATVELYFWADPNSADASALLADVLDYLDRVRARRVGIPGQTPIPATSGRNAVRVESIGVQAAGGLTNGRTDLPFNDTTVDLTRGI